MCVNNYYLQHGDMQVHSQRMQSLQCLLGQGDVDQLPTGDRISYLTSYPSIYKALGMSGVLW